MDGSRSNQKHQRYGLRLSWPRTNDRRRAAVSKSSPSSQSLPVAGKISGARFVHTSHWDFELYHSLASPVPVRTLSLLDIPYSWNPSRLKSLDHDLLKHCKFYIFHIALTELSRGGIADRFILTTFSLLCSVRIPGYIWPRRHSPWEHPGPNFPGRGDGLGCGSAPGTASIFFVTSLRLAVPSL
jgi:hypothetical protein